MQQYSLNSACHDFDIWYQNVGNKWEIRNREKELYFPDANPQSEDEILMCFQSSFYVEEWINSPHLLNNYVQIPIDPVELLKYSNKNFSGEMYRAINEWLTGDPVFVRTSSSSPKDVVGIHHSEGVQSKALISASDILYTIATSERCKEYIFSNHYPDRSIWISPYINLYGKHHFRVFIRDGKIRAISQNDSYDTFTSDLDVIRKLKDRIFCIWDDVQKSHTIWYLDTCMDVVLLDPDIMDMRIVEYNEFGCSSRAGSALYNWIQDFHILYFSDEIDVRLN